MMMNRCKTRSGVNRILTIRSIVNDITSTSMRWNWNISSPTIKICYHDYLKDQKLLFSSSKTKLITDEEKTSFQDKMPNEERKKITKPSEEGKAASKTKKDKGKSRKVKNSLVMRYLRDELGYDLKKDLGNVRTNYPELFEKSVQIVKSSHEMLVSNGLPGKILFDYAYVFMRDNFKSFPAQIEMLAYVKKRLQISDDEVIMELLNNNPEFLIVRRDEIAKKLDVFQEDISVASVEDLRMAMSHRKGMWLKSENDLRNILRLLKEEYGMKEEELRDWFTKGKSTALLSEKMLVDAAERKLIFEDVYGKGCFSTNKKLRTQMLTFPFLFTISTSRLSGTICRWMDLFSYERPYYLEWLPVSLLYTTNLDRLETRFVMTYKYLTNGKELKKGEEKKENGEERYKVEKRRYEENQNELERKYRMDALVTGVSDASKDEPTTSYDDIVEEPISIKMKKTRSTSIDEKKLYQDYVRSIRGELTNTDLEENAYEELIKKTLKEFMEKGMVDPLKNVDGYDEWMSKLQMKLEKAGLKMEDLYRELWKGSEGIELNHEQAMAIITSGSGLTSQLHQPMQKLGMMSIYLGLDNQVANKVVQRSRAHSIENGVFPRLHRILPVVQRYLKNSSNCEVPQIIDMISDANKDQVLRECVELYRNHPIRKELRSFVLHNISQFLCLSSVRWEKGIQAWESSDEKKHNLLSLYSFVRSQQS